MAQQADELAVVVVEPPRLSLLDQRQAAHDLLLEDEGHGECRPLTPLLHRGAILVAQRAKSAADLPDLPRLFDSLETARIIPTRADLDTP